MDTASEAKLISVHPLLAAKIRQMASILEGEGTIITVTQGLRSWQDQARLYAQGRTAPGPIVTHAPPGHSWHQFGLAVDLVPLAGGRPDWNATHPTWQRIVQLGNSLGLTEGAGFRSFPDWPHQQLTGSWPVSPTDEVRQTFLIGGVPSVWEASGLVQDGTQLA